MVVGVIRTVFAQPDLESARDQLAKAVDTLQERYPGWQTCWSEPLKTPGPI